LGGGVVRAVSLQTRQVNRAELLLARRPEGDPIVFGSVSRPAAPDFAKGLRLLGVIDQGRGFVGANFVFEDGGGIQAVVGVVVESVPEAALFALRTADEDAAVGGVQNIPRAVVMVSDEVPVVGAQGGWCTV